jgi:hypothetical protein
MKSMSALAASGAWLIATIPAAGMRLTECFAVAAEDIRHLQSRSHDARSSGWHDFQAEPVERARRVADGLGGDPCTRISAGATPTWLTLTYFATSIRFHMPSF